MGLHIGERAVCCCIKAQGKGLRAAGQRTDNCACQRGIQRKRGVSSHAGAPAVVATGNRASGNAQCMLLPVKTVAACHVSRTERRSPSHAQLRDCKLINHNTHRQAQGFRRASRACFGLPVVYGHSACSKAVQLESATDQRPGLPCQRDGSCIDFQALTLPGDAVKLATVPQRSTWVLKRQIGCQLRRVVVSPTGSCCQ